MRDDHLNKIQATNHGIWILEPSSVVIKNIRGIKWFKKEKLNIENFKPAAIIRGKIIVYNLEPSKTSNKALFAWPINIFDLSFKLYDISFIDFLLLW